MLPSSRRISRTLFETVMKEGKLVHSTYFTMRIGSSDVSQSRFSVVVSKKVAGKATKRNALRRKGYECVARLYDKTVPGKAAILFAKKGAETQSFATLLADVMSLLAKASIISITQ